MSNSNAAIDKFKLLRSNTVNFARDTKYKAAKIEGRLEGWLRRRSLGGSIDDSSNKQAAEAVEAGPKHEAAPEGEGRVEKAIDIEGNADVKGGTTSPDDVADAAGVNHSAEKQNATMTMSEDVVFNQPMVYNAAVTFNRGVVFNHGDAVIFNYKSEYASHRSEASEDDEAVVNNEHERGEGAHGRNEYENEDAVSDDNGGSCDDGANNAIEAGDSLVDGAAFTSDDGAKAWGWMDDAGEFLDDWKPARIVDLTTLRGCLSLGENVNYSDPRALCYVPSKVQFQTLQRGLELAQEALWNALHDNWPEFQLKHWPEGPHEVRFGMTELEAVFPFRNVGVPSEANINMGSILSAAKMVSELRNSVCHPVRIPNCTADEWLRRAQELAVDLEDEKRAFQIRGLRDRLIDETKKAYEEIRHGRFDACWPYHHQRFFDHVLSFYPRRPTTPDGRREWRSLEADNMRRAAHVWKLDYVKPGVMHYQALERRKWASWYANTTLEDSKARNLFFSNDLEPEVGADRRASIGEDDLFITAWLATRDAMTESGDLNLRYCLRGSQDDWTDDTFKLDCVDWEFGKDLRRRFPPRYPDTPTSDQGHPSSNWIAETCPGRSWLR